MVWQELTHFDASQVLKFCYDEDKGAIRTLTTIEGLTLSIDYQSDSIRLGSDTGLITGSTVSTKVGLDVNIIGGVVSGEFSASGLKTAMVAQEVIVTDVASKVPLTPLLDRNGISVRVWNLLDTSIVVYFGDNTVTAAHGYPKLHREEIVIDIKDNPTVELWAICDAGKTAKLRVLEVA